MIRKKRPITSTIWNNLLANKTCCFIPDPIVVPIKFEDTDNANVLPRAEVLNRINSQKPAVIVSLSPEAPFGKVVTKVEETLIKSCRWR